jgi:hypothetical protein
MIFCSIQTQEYMRDLSSDWVIMGYVSVGYVGMRYAQDMLAVDMLAWGAQDILAQDCGHKMCMKCVGTG